MAVTRIRLRRGTAAAWAAADPVLAAGEAGVDLDTGELRIGDGTKAWSALTPIGVVPESEIASAVQAYLLANPLVLGLTDLSDVTVGDSTEGDVLTLGPGGEWGPATIPAPDLSGYVETTDARLSDARTPTTHTHAPIDVTGTAVVTSDARLSDARTPTAHKASHATGGTDALTPADIGAQPAGSYAAASHAQAASTISDSTAVGRSVLTAADAAAARTAIGAGTSSFSGAYADLSGKPTLGTAAATAATDYATAAQGALADSAAASLVAFQMAAAGSYVTPAVVASSAVGISIAPGWPNFAVLVIGRDVTVGRIGLEVTAAVADSEIRFGVWTNSAGSVPGDVVIDSGALSSATDGFKETVLSTPVLLPAGIYWVGAYVSATLSVRGLTSGVIPAMQLFTSPAASRQVAGSAAWPSGGLPNNPDVASASDKAPYVVLRVVA